MSKELDIIGKKMASGIRAEFFKKGLVDTAKAVQSVKHKVKGGAVSIVWLPRVHYLLYGRGPGKRPPFDIIKEWVERRLKPPKKAVWAITDTICSKIAKHGTRLFTDKSRRLQVKLVLSEGIKEIKSVAVAFEKERVKKAIKKAWV